jgi:nitrite reductase/ring-hydroxylating ferredoxin subunit
MKKFLLLVVIPLAFLSCGKRGDVIPNVGVNISFVRTDPTYSALNVPTGHKLINGGVAGIILYRTINMDYVAYDRCSSYQPEKHCAVTIDESGFTATDPCSGSKFSLFDGTPAKAPATRSLKSYYVQVSQDQVFISN